MQKTQYAQTNMGSATDRGCIWLMNRIVQVASEYFDAGPEAANLTIRQAYVLAAIGDQGQPTQKEVCLVTGIDRSTMSELLRRLVRRGLVRARRSSKDRRATILQLTEEGRTVCRLGQLAIVEAERKLLAGSSADDRRQLRDRLDVLLSDALSR